MACPSDEKPGTCPCWHGSCGGQGDQKRQGDRQARHCPRHAHGDSAGDVGLRSVAQQFGVGVETVRRCLSEPGRPAATRLVARYDFGYGKRWSENWLLVSCLSD
jgi:hypothetical protein